MTGQCLARCNYTSVIEQLKDAKVNEQTVQNADASSLTCDAAVTSCLGSQLASPGNCWNCGGAFSSDHQCDVSPVKPESVKLANSLNLPPDLEISKQRQAFSLCTGCAEEASPNVGRQSSFPPSPKRQEQLNCRNDILL